MNAFDMARTAYGTTSQAVKTPRDTEYDAFARITRQLRAAAENQGRDFSGFIRALDINRRLWTILATDVADKQNALPKQLRAQIFYLAEFTLQHTNKVMNRKGDVAILIDINMAIMRGLQNKEATA